MSKAFVAIHCETGKESPVIRKLMEIRGISEVTGTLGLYDIIIKVEASDSMALEKIITKEIRKVQHVLTTMTLMVI
jgi:DNA-binding Lrp family transcriptional regulator